MTQDAAQWLPSTLSISKGHFWGHLHHTHTHIHMGGGEKGWRFWRGSGGLARFYEVLLTAGIYTKSNEMFNKHFALRKSQ